MNIFLIDEACRLDFALFGNLGAEKLVDVELVIALVDGDVCRNGVGHLVGKHDHFGQSGIWIFAQRLVPIFFCRLLVRIGPIEHLIFQKLARIERAEGRAGKIEIVPRRDGQKTFVDRVARLFELIFFEIEVVVFFIELFKQIFRILAPCAEVVFVKDDDVPIGGVDKLVFRLDPSEVVGAEQVLERTEHDNGSRLVASVVLFVQFFCVELRLFVGDKLPTLEMDMPRKVFLPRRLDSRLESEHKDLFEVHRLAKLIGRESLAEAHFRVPKELGRARGVVGFCLFKIRLRHLDGDFLLVAHGKIPSALPLKPCFRAQLFHRRQGVRECTAKPFVSVLAFVELQKAFVSQQPVHVFIRKASAVGTHRGLFEQDLELDRRGMQLLFYARLDIAIGVADLDVAVVIFQIGQDIAVYRRHHGGAGM